jgi:hypothetical protein
MKTRAMTQTANLVSELLHGCLVVKLSEEVALKFCLDLMMLEETGNQTK